MMTRTTGNHASRPRNDRRGFSYLDLIMAMGLMVGLQSLLYTGEVALRHRSHALELRARVLFLLQEYLELSCPELPYQAPSRWQSRLFDRHDGIRGAMYVEPSPTHPFMRSVLVKAWWSDPEGGPEHTLQLTRLVPDHVALAGRFK